MLRETYQPWKDKDGMTRLYVDQKGLKVTRDWWVQRGFEVITDITLQLDRRAKVRRPTTYLGDAHPAANNTLHT